MINGIDSLYHMKNSNQEKALDKVCKEFESLFAHQLVKVMGESTGDGGLFEEGIASDIYKDMLFQAMGDSLAESGSLGIGKALKENLQKNGNYCGRKLVR